MATHSTDTRDGRQTVAPNPALAHLAPLVGTWEVSGPTISGRITYEWMEGGFFLMQHLDLDHDGRPIKGIEVIGRLHTLGDEPSKEIWSRVYSALDGLTLDYVYELVGDTLTIWGGFVGSPARYMGTFSDDRTTCVGAWEWPGGGYEATMTRTKGE